jgi:hypothetical protein
MGTGLAAPRASSTDREWRDRVDDLWDALHQLYRPLVVLRAILHHALLDELLPWPAPAFKGVA